MVRYLICRPKKQYHQWPTQCTRRTGTLLQWVNIRTTVNLPGLWTQGCGWRQDHIYPSTTKNTDRFKIFGQWQKETQRGNSLRNRNYRGQLHWSDKNSLRTQEIQEGPEESGRNANHSSIPSQIRNGGSVGLLGSWTWKKLKNNYWRKGHCTLIRDLIRRHTIYHSLTTMGIHGKYCIIMTVAHTKNTS